MSEAMMAAPPSQAAGKPLVEAERHPFFAVSLPKFMLMSFCTYGIYELYWFFRNWEVVEARSNIDTWPLTRALFSPLLCYACLRHIRADGVAKDMAPLPGIAFLSLAWAATSLAFQLPGYYGMLVHLGPLFLAPVQFYVNRVNAVAAPKHDRNARFSGSNCAAILLGGGLYVVLLTKALGGQN